jgi:hypothetical protein
MQFRTLNTVRLVSLGIATISFTATLTIALAAGFGSRIVTFQIRAHDLLGPFTVALFFTALSCLLAISNETRASLRHAMRIGVFTLFGLSLVLLAALSIKPLPEAYPTSDAAVSEIYTLHSIRSIWPFGPYSQYGWNHPGPAMYYALAPIYIAADYHNLGLKLGAFALNLGLLISLLRLLFVHSRPAVAAAVAAVLALMIVRIGGRLIISDWNPHLIPIPLLLFLVVVAQAITRAPSALLSAIAVGSFISQTHVSMVPFVILIAASALVAAKYLANRSDVRWRMYLNRAAWLAMVLWLLPLAEELVGPRGNATLLWRFLRENVPDVTWTESARMWLDLTTSVIMQSVTLPVGHGVVRSPHVLPELVILIALCAGAVYALYRARGEKHSFERVLLLLALTGLVVGLWSLSRLRHPVYDHQIFWIALMGAFNIAIVAGSLFARWAERADANGRSYMTSIVVVVTSVMIVATAGSVALIGDVNDLKSRQRGSAVVERLYEPIRAYLAAHGNQPIVIRPTQAAWEESAGIVLQFYKERYPVAVDPSWVHIFGSPLEPTGKEQFDILILDSSSGDESLNAFPNAETIATVDTVGVFISKTRR